MQKLNADAVVPLYQQLCEAIKEKINHGEYKVGDRIPSEEQLSKMYGISRITVRSGVEKLCEDNILVKKHGKGTFVSLPIHVESTKAGNSFTESCKQIGAIPTTKIISLALVESNSKIARLLDIKEGSKVICIKRLRLVNGVPTILEIDYFNERFNFLLDKQESGSLLELVRNKTGLTTSKFKDIFDVKLASEEQANHLDIKKGSALLRVTQIVMTDTDEIVYCNEQYICTEHYKYVVKR